MAAPSLLCFFDLTDKTVSLSSCLLCFLGADEGCNSSFFCCGWPQLEMGGRTKGRRGHTFPPGLAWIKEKWQQVSKHGDNKEMLACLWGVSSLSEYTKFQLHTGDPSWVSPPSCCSWVGGRHLACSFPFVFCFWASASWLGGCYGMELGEQEWPIIYTFMYAHYYHRLVSTLWVGYEWFIYCKFISWVKAS